MPIRSTRLTGTGTTLTTRRHPPPQQPPKRQKTNRHIEASRRTPLIFRLKLQKCLDETIKQIYSGIMRNELFSPSHSHPKSSPSGQQDPLSTSRTFHQSPAKRCLFQSPPSAKKCNTRPQTTFQRIDQRQEESSSISQSNSISHFQSSSISQFQSSSISQFHTFSGPLRLRDSPLKQTYSISPISISSQTILNSPKKKMRHIAKVPFKVLDAPELQVTIYG